MNITFNKHTALVILRLAHQGPWYQGVSFLRHDLELPQATGGPGGRWTARKLRALLGSIADKPIHVAVPSQSSRLKVRGVINTVYSEGLPSGAFVQVDEGISISSPELLFVEMAALMSPVIHLMFAYELCGRFARNPFDPRDGSVMFWAKPMTTVDRLRAFVGQAFNIRGLDRARETLELLGGCAWSPMEAIIATMAAIPVYELGYGFADLSLNERVELTDGRSRVPDILFGDTMVGINYDGNDHLDLDSVERAAMDVALAPDVGVLREILASTKGATRAKVLDDIRRNRDLGSRGYVVFPATKEDLYERGGLDRLMSQVFEAIGHFSTCDVSECQARMANGSIRRKRYELLLALLPGPAGKNHLDMLKDRWWDRSRGDETK